VTDGPRRLADLKPGVRLREEATGALWTIERVVRANSYSTPWVHLTPEGPNTEPAERVEGAGALIDGSAGWSYV
jgi:hypothetical protein